MKNLFLLIPVLGFCSLLLAQPKPQCDSTYMAVFAKEELKPENVPCDSVVLINAKYYQKIAIGYNLSQDIQAEQLVLAASLKKEINLFESLNNQQEGKVNALERANTEYRKQIGELTGLVNTSTKNTETAVKNTQDAIDLYNTNKWKFLGFGLLGGAAVGILTGVLIMTR